MTGRDGGATPSREPRQTTSPPRSPPWRGLLGRLRARLAGREDSEHEQALIRFGVIAGMYAYMLLAPFPEEDRARVFFWSSVLFAGGTLSALLLFLDILRRPRPSPARRVAGILVDTTGVNAAMLIGGHLATPFYPLLLWLIFGHGFRYGRAYLFTAAGLSLVMFGGVVVLSRDWRAYPVLDASLILALVVLPAYVSVLQQRLADALARAREANEAKSRFLATMSHEFRTPLNAIIGMSELLRTTRLDHEQEEMAATIRSAAHSLLGLVNAVLDLSRLESRGLEVVPVTFDLDRRLATLRAMLLPAATEKGLYLRLELDPATPVHLRGGEQPLHQVLVNLVANAIRFTERGGVVVAVRPSAVEEGTVRLRFEVRDTGIGIAPEAQERIFERFEQAGDGTAHRFGGTGLGLSIARELVDLMGGRIGVESQPGRGSTFWCELPFTALPEGDLALPAQTFAVCLGDPLEAVALSQRLSAFGVRTRAVSALEEAVATVERVTCRRAVLVTGTRPPVDLARLADALLPLCRAEPVDIVTVGVAGDGDHPCCLARLPAEVEDRVLRRVLHAAFAPAGITDGPQTAARSIPRATRRARVLVAEDNRTNQIVIERVLEHAGHEVVLVADGHEVIERLERERFDLVLLDINMPEMSGPETVKLLRFTHAPADLPPLVALSADATAETRRRCLELGFTDYLTKPLDAAALIETIDQLITARDHGRPAAARRLCRPAAERPAAAESAVVVPHPATRRPRHSSVLDERKLAALAELDRGDGFLAGLVREFLADAENLIDQLATAADAGDSRTFRDVAHALRSSAAHIGAQALFDHCMSWRKLDDHALVMRGPQEVARARQELERVREALRRYQAGGRGAGLRAPGN